MARKFERFRRHKFVNATIRLDNGRKFSVHKSLLAQESDFFKALFKFHDKKEFALSGVDGRLFGKLLDCFYEGRARLTTRDAFRLRGLADYFLCPDILTYTSETIKSRAHHGNIFRLRSLCTKNEANDLAGWCMEYIEINIHEIGQSSEFLSLPLDTLKATLHRLRSSPRVSQIWNAVGSWILFDKTNRSSALLQLMVLARVHELGSDFQEQVFPVLQMCNFGWPELVDFVKLLFATWESNGDNMEEEFGEGFSSDSESEEA